MRSLLSRGVKRRAIAEELGVSPSTVTRTARLLGFPDEFRRPSPTDWQAVQAYYDAGHTIDECKARFGFSYGAWDKAATRGDIVPRPRSNRQLSRRTRDEIEHLIAKGVTQAQIRRQLGLSKSTVAYHVRKLGVRADPRFARRHDWGEVQRVIDEEGLSMTQCLGRFGFGKDAWYLAVKRGDIVPRPHKASIDELLVAGRKRSRGHIKTRLLQSGLKQNRCERCGLSEWMGEPLNMELHHVNGDGTDNRLRNIELLCPNCHAQTDNWGGRGIRRRASMNGSRPG